MMKREAFQPNHFYLIRNSGNNLEPIFIEERNYFYFLELCQKHISQIGKLLSYRLFPNGFELLVEIKNVSEIPLRYQEKIHLPFSNLFNAYCKAINKTYGRSGSLFREHFSRTCLSEGQASNMKTAMEQRTLHPKSA